MNIPIKRVGWLSALVAFLFCNVSMPASAQQACSLTISPPGASLTSYITAYPGFNTQLSPQQQLVATAIVDVTNVVNRTNYTSSPLPYGHYLAWCMDEYETIPASSITIPGTLFTGALYSTCDPDLNSELPSGHPNTLVSSNVWQMVNYILNHKTYHGTNVFYWDVQDAINTLVGSAVGAADTDCGGTYNTPAPEGTCDEYPFFDPVVVNGLLTAASNNAATWVPECGNVIGAVYVTQPTTNQFVLIEVPVPCVPCIAVTKQIACLQPTNNCGEFGQVASGYAGAGCSGANQPAFCYQITITNCGTIPLTN